MKKFILFAVFALLFVGFLAALGEAEGKSPPGVEVGYYDLQLLAPVVSVEVEKPAVIALVEVNRLTFNGLEIYEIVTIYKTEGVRLRRLDLRLWSNSDKEVKSLYGYNCLEHETTGAKENILSNICKGAFKTEYG